MSKQDDLTTLKKQIDLESNHANMVDSLLEQAYQIRSLDTPQAIALCEQAYQLAHDDSEIVYMDGVIESLLLKGYCHQLISQYQEFITHSQKALYFAQQYENKTLIAKSYLRLGQGYTRIGEYLDGYKQINQAIMMLLEINEPMILVMAKQSLALLLVELGHFEKAQEENFQALKLAEDNQFYDVGFVIRNNIADTYLKLGNYEAAIQFGEHVVSFIKQNESYFLRSFIGSILSLCYLEIDDLAQAEYYVKLFFEDIKQNNDLKGLAMAHHAKAKLALKQGNYDDAKIEAETAVSIAKEIGAPDDEYENLEVLSQILERLGEYHQALEAYKVAQEIKHTIFNRNATYRMQILEISYQTEKAKHEANLFRLKSLDLESEVNEKTESLTEKTEALEQSLARETQLGQELKEALKRTEHLSQLKTKIIETVSHEFRTPLTVMNTSSELLRFHSERLSEEKQHKHLKHIQEAVRYLTEILNETIFIGQMSQYPLTPVYKKYQESEFCKLFIDEIYESLGESSGIEILCQVKETSDEENQSIIADMHLMHRATLNLITNAIKYSEDVSSIMVMVQVDVDAILIDVADKGIGIPVEDQESIFDLFYRADNARIHRGVGFGLHIAKRICEVLSAEITVFSEGEGKGSQFKMRFPKSPQITRQISKETQV